MTSEELKHAVRGEVLSDAATLDHYSTDASIFKVVPQVVVCPQDTADVASVVKFVRAKKDAGENVSLTGRSAGTDMGGGPLNTGVVMDFTKHFTRIFEVGDDYAVVEPGVYFRDFEKEINKKNLMLPSYPASKGLCAIGGVVSNNSGGEKSLTYGKTEKYVEELEVVLSNGDVCTMRALNQAQLDEKLKLQTFEGEIYRKVYQLIKDNYEMIEQARPHVSKNSAGYYLWNIWDKTTFDLSKLIVGSQGTLAMVTKVKFKLVQRKAHSRLAVIFMNDLKPLANIVNEVLKFNPESFESFDDNTLKLALKFFPEIVKIMKGNAISLGFQFIPEAMMVLRHGLPKLILLVEITSDDENEITQRLQALKEALKKFDIAVRLMKNEQEGEKYWVMRRESFNLLRQKIRDKQTAPFIDDFIVRPETLPQFLPRLNAILDQYAHAMIYTIAGHAGDGNFHIIPLMNLEDPKSREVIPELMEKVYSLVLEFKGSITAEHNDGLVRSPYLRRMYGDQIYALFEETKKIFDPADIFNPGKKVGSDLKYSLKHIK